MAKPYALTTAQWERVAPLLPSKASDPGRTAADNRLPVHPADPAASSPLAPYSTAANESRRHTWLARFEFNARAVSDISELRIQKLRNQTIRFPRIGTAVQF